MTKLTKPVRRVVPADLPSRPDLVVTLLPATGSLGPAIELRHARTRDAKVVELARLHTLLAVREAGIPTRRR